MAGLGRERGGGSWENEGFQRRGWAKKRMAGHGGGRGVEGDDGVGRRWGSGERQR